MPLLRTVAASALILASLGACHDGAREAPATVAAPLEFSRGTDPDLPPPARGAADEEATVQPVERLVEEGRGLEAVGRFPEARGKYQQAEALDPADPIVLIHLGEFARHHDGDWPLAARYFERVLACPGADDEVRALAMHGLGKMRIWNGDYDAGRELIERSLATFPTPLACRNLAVYWFSEKDGQQRGHAYAERALALAPDDPYNQVFFATFLAYDGKRDEALATLRSVPFDPSMHYNYAAVYAELGDGERALTHLRQHFYEYEFDDRVRAYEMEEARSDYHFRSLARDPRFLELTSLGQRPASKPMPFWAGAAAAP